MKGTCIWGKDGKVIERKSYDPDTEMTKEEFLKSLQKIYLQYQEMFGYIPDFDDFSCTRKEYVKALGKCFKEKKEISEYLKCI